MSDQLPANPIAPDQSSDEAEESLPPTDSEAIEEAAATDLPATDSVDPEWANATAAWVLGVLNESDASEAAVAFAKSPELLRELSELKPVADILITAYQQSGQATPVAEPMKPAAIAVAVTPEAASAPTRNKPTRPERALKTTTNSARSLNSVPAGKLAIGLVAVVAALAILWAFALIDKVSTRDDEIDALSTQVAQLKGSGNASAYLLFPTADGGTAQGTLYYSPANASALIDVTNLPVLGANRVYQVWFQREGSTAWEPGPTFLVNSGGEAVQRLSGDAPTFAKISITEEAAPASSAPTGPFLLTGTLAQAAG